LHARLACRGCAGDLCGSLAMRSVSFLERRWSSRTFRYGYLVTTSPQSWTTPWSSSPLRLD